MDNFTPISETDDIELIMKYSKTFRELDAASRWLIKQCITVLSVPMTKIDNLSLGSGSFRTIMKSTKERTLTEEAGLEINELNKATD